MPGPERAAPVFAVSLLVGACAAAPVAVSPRSEPRVLWPTAPAEVVDQCRGAHASGCYQEALATLATAEPDLRRAEHLLAAACEAELREACSALETRFRPPSATRIPSLASGVTPRPSTVVMEFECRVSTAGTLERCTLTRSHGSTWGLDRSLGEGILAAVPGARLVPATFEGMAYETDLRLVYLLPPTGVGGTTSNAFQSEVAPNALLFRNLGDRGVNGGP